jgi:hypothetical protein
MGTTVVKPIKKMGRQQQLLCFFFNQENGNTVSGAGNAELFAYIVVQQQFMYTS